MNTKLFVHFEEPKTPVPRILHTTHSKFDSAALCKLGREDGADAGCGSTAKPRHIKGGAGEHNKFLNPISISTILRDWQINVNVNVISASRPIWTSVRPHRKFSDARRTDVRRVGYYCG